MNSAGYSKSPVNRPILDALTVRRGRRHGEQIAKLKPETRARLERIGWERALIYKMLVLTGLRRNELTSLSVGQCHLDVPMPYIELHAGDEKNRQGCQIPLRADLVADLRDWIASKWQDDSEPTVIAMKTVRKPSTIESECLFDVPQGLNRISET